MERATSSIVNSVVCAFERYISIAKQDQFLKESLELAKGNNCSAVAMCMGLE